MAKEENAFALHEYAARVSLSCGIQQHHVCRLRGGHDIIWQIESSLDTDISNSFSFHFAFFSMQIPFHSAIENL